MTIYAVVKGIKEPTILIMTQDKSEADAVLHNQGGCLCYREDGKCSKDIRNAKNWEEFEGILLEMDLL